MYANYRERKSYVLITEYENVCQSYVLITENENVC